ncbi:MAG: hypothetical protein Q9M94_04120 [Candidatus Gracilibacteria bacterium]|nr:hypothetical protein [Candidatus Gracilibacteria bacterium]MDQ7023035.1 hypothetical protein [Candidatus Gracilibacteria bacterium]
MKIIITDFFEKNLKKVVKDLSIEDIISKINIESKNFVDLNSPYFKVKINSKNKTYRLLLSYDKENIIILFIRIFDKKDKLIGENINWKIHKEKIIEWRNKNIEDIKKGNYRKVFM